MFNLTFKRMEARASVYQPLLFQIGDFFVSLED